MDDLNRHATRSRILGNLLRKYGCKDASEDNYRARVEVHDGECVSSVLSVESRRKEGVFGMFRMADLLAFCKPKPAICA